MATSLISRMIPDAKLYGDPQLQTDGELVALAFAADGSLWSVEEPGVVRHWNAVTGQALAWHSSCDLETLWCFSAGGHTLASGSNDLSIWDTASGQLLTALPQSNWVTAIAFHPDPTFLATGADDGTVRFWDAAGHQLVRKFHLDNMGISAVAISPDGQRLAAASENKHIHVWSLSDGQLLCSLTGHTDRIPALQWLPDSRRLVSAGWDTSARLWDTDTGQPIILFNGHAAQVFCLASTRTAICSPVPTPPLPFTFGTWWTTAAASCSLSPTWKPGAWRSARTVVAWRAPAAIRSFVCGIPTTGQPLSVSARRLPANPGMALSPNGKMLALNHGAAGPEVWDVASQQLMGSLTESEPVHTLAFSPDGGWIAGGADTHVQLWDATTGRPLRALEGQEEPCTTLGFAPDSQTLAGASSSGMMVWLWRVADGEPILVIPDPLEGCVVEALAFHPGGRLLAVGGIDWLATGGSDGAISLWDVEERCEVATFIGGTRAIVFDRGGRRLASVSLQESVHVWDIKTGELIQELIGHEGQVLCVAFSPDGRFLATGGEDRTVRLWDPVTGATRAVRELDSQVRVLTFSPDGRQLFTGNGNTTCYRLPVSALFSHQE